MTPKSVPKDEGISGVAPLGAPLVAQTAFGHQKVVPSAAQVLPMIEKSIKKNTKEPPQLRKRCPEFKFFGNLARRNARSAYNNLTMDYGLCKLHNLKNVCFHRTVSCRRHLFPSGLLPLLMFRAVVPLSQQAQIKITWPLS
jgi:hypothetical protein